jgi:hypothetical protein
MTNNPTPKSLTRIYLMSGRKEWHYDESELRGWKEVAWERFDYVECAIFEKPTSKLTKQDRALVRSYGEKPEGWINPQ